MTCSDLRRALQLRSSTMQRKRALLSSKTTRQKAARLQAAILCRKALRPSRGEKRGKERGNGWPPLRTV